ncbi:MAG: transposase, partial [Verrucomicrobiae bacterium]|nr:transposase [Verrucomicrobiae bacterium]
MKTKPTTSSANTIGIDLGDRKHAVCVLDAKGRVIRIETIANTRAALTALSRRHRRALV